MTSTQTPKGPGNQEPNHELQSWLNSVRDNPEEPSRDGGFCTYNALAFNTLLSSQETDTHHRGASAPPPGQPLNLTPLHPSCQPSSWNFPRLLPTTGIVRPPAVHPREPRVRQTRSSGRRLLGGSPGPVLPCGV